MARTVNFVCPKTGKEFFFAEYKTSFKNGCPVYKDMSGNLLINPDNNEPLRLITNEVDEYKPISIQGSEDEKWKKRVDHYKGVAKEHNKSDEVKEIKQKAVEREMGKDVARIVNRNGKEKDS